LLVEGLPAESFIDDADRLVFDKWAEYRRLHPDGKPITELPHPCAGRAATSRRPCTHG